MRYICVLMAGVFAATLSAREDIEDKYATWGPRSDSGWGYLIRGGFALGGTSPLPLPREIRSINRFRPEGGLTFGVDAYKMFSRRWGLMAGAHFFTEGMHTGADVKNYHMGISQGEDYLEGYFTGTDVTETFMAGFTIPVMATFRISPRWNVNLGPYVSFVLGEDFEGSVYDGYLREGTPTGPKVIISGDNAATYDFAENMRSVLYGVELGFDYKVRRGLTVFGSVDWGMTSVFHSNFKTVDFPMYPLYATFGVACHY
ncbi:MAG: PorT family protein [Clostridium sp.]|nr:PorT family protein [Clostridium sp.]